MAICLALLAIGVATGAAAASPSSSRARAGSGRVRATASRAVPRALARAASRSTTADRTLVADAKALRRCLAAHSSQPSVCDGARGALQRAGRRLKAAERSLSKVASDTASARSASWGGGSATVQAPTITVSGQSLSWNRVDNVNSYVFVRKVPGQADQYSTVTGTSITPPPVPGLTVRYSVRAAVNGSAWASERAITYPKAAEPPAETPPVETPVEKPAEKPPVETQAAPTLHVSGQTISWTEVGGVSTYVLAIKVPGKEEKYTEVSGTSVTPSAVPGVTVRYSLRTAVEGSAWSTEVAISYPAETPPPPPPAKESEKTEETQPGSLLTGPMWVGVDAGGWPSSFASDIAGAASYVRLESPSSISGWTAAGLKVIDDMAGPYNSGGVAAVNATEWAAKAVAEVKANPQIAAIEVLNEPGNQWIGWGSSAGDAANAAAYDHLLKVVHEAFVANFGSNYPAILASYDGGEGPTTWGQEMWAAEPNVGNYINGVTLHSYGGTSNRTHSALGDREQIEKAHSQHPDMPIYITEVGWPTAVGQPSTGDSFQWTESEQAQNITNFVDWAKGTGYIQDVTIFNYRDYGTNDWYGIESASGAHKLSYTALAAFK
ncbi:MAG: hypothetical protein ACLPUT_18165 [Solirubrobacteraceae bacterium]